MSDDIGICRNLKLAAQRGTIAMGEGMRINTGGNHREMRFDSAIAQDLRHALAGGNDGIAQIGITDGQRGNEPRHCYRC